jgi:hypothetical protein
VTSADLDCRCDQLAHWSSILRRPRSARPAQGHTLSAYAELDFDVPVGIKGDNYDRYYVRMRR